MQKAFGQPLASLPVRVTAPARSRSVIVKERSLRVDLPQIWRAAIGNLIAQPAPLLLCGLVFYTLPAVPILAAQTITVVSAFQRTGSIVALYQEPSPLLIAFRLAVLTLSTTIIRAAVTHLTVRSSDDGRATRNMVRRALPVLFFGAFIQTAIFVVAHAWLSPVLRSLRFDGAQAWHVWMGLDRAMGDIAQQTVWRAATQLWPQVELAPWLNTPHLRMDIELGLSALSCVVIAVTDVSFRFVAVTAMQLQRARTHRLRLFASLINNLKINWHRPRVVLSYVVVVNAGLFATSLVLIQLPIACVEHIILPQLIHCTGIVLLIPAMIFAMHVAAFVVQSGMLVLSGLCDLQLHQTLTSGICDNSRR